MSQVLHIGVGNFHRAHQAWYTANAPGEWGITGVSLRNSAVRDALEQQDWRYTLAIKDREGVRYDTVDVISHIMVAPENPSAVLAAIASNDTAAITVTVTEKGYTLDGKRQLDLAHADIRHDLAEENPVSLVGYLARGLALRSVAGAAPVTVLSCDNLPGNGRVLQAAVARFIEAASIDLELDNIAAFPDSMVDRITPATTAELVAECAAATGVQDQAPVETEAFSDWVIESRCVGTLPDWASSGAVWVDDVAPFEMRKLRLLNGTHTLMAHLGRFRGHAYVHEAIADPVVCAAVEALMHEAIGTLPGAARIDVDDYCDALKRRYANPALHHALAQIAVDSSIKLGVRILPVLEARTASGEPNSACCTAMAAWAAQSIVDVESGCPVSDPAGAEIESAVRSHESREERVAALLEVLKDNLASALLVESVLAVWPEQV